MKKKILLAIAASGATLLLAVVAAEIYFRQTASGAPLSPYSTELHTHDGRKASAPVGSFKLALSPFTVYQNLPSQHTAAININSRGLRAPEGAEQDSRPKIVFLGGSAAFGVGADTDDDTITAILQESFKSHRFLNAGVVGFQSGQELTYLITDLIDYQPEVVVAYNGWNDVYDVAYLPERDPNKLGFNSTFFGFENQLVVNYQSQVSFSDSLSQLVRTSLKKSLVLQRLFPSLRTRQSRVIAQTFNNLSSDRQKALLDSIVKTYVNNVRKMAVVSHARGAKFLVVLQPELGQRPNPTLKERERLNAATIHYQEFMPRLYREFLNETKPLLTREGIDWIDVNESTMFQTTPETIFADMIHTNRRGNELAAQSIAAKLQLLLEKK